jgi:hypothetical protein
MLCYGEPRGINPAANEPGQEFINRSVSQYVSDDEAIYRMKGKRKVNEMG